MATKKTTTRLHSVSPRQAKSKGANHEAEIRLQVTNWDKEVPVMTNKRSDRPSSRKVLTKGVITFGTASANAATEDAAVLSRILAVVRAGYEYRMVDENGEEALRFIPVVEKDMKTVTLVAQTMGSFRGSLNDKEVKPFYQGEEVPRTKAAKMVIEAQKDDAAYRSSRVNVSPDMVVTCPECGTEFRVGKQLG